jgi:hypothetical protein
MIEARVYSLCYLPEVSLLLFSQQPDPRDRAQAWLAGMVRRMVYLEP